jgi:predicted nucleic acid-binding protein
VALIIDTSAILAVVANEPERPALIAATSGHELIAPGSVPWEIGNALSAMLKRRRITPAQAQEAVAIFRRIQIQFVDVDLSRAVRIAAEANIYAYDAYLIACAQSRGLPLLTLDRGLARTAAQAGVPLVEVQG